MSTTKKNVSVFNKDVLANDGFRYSTNAPFSSIVANRRLTEITSKLLAEIKPQSIIDVGCGDGVYTNELQVLFPKVSFFGNDPAHEAIKLASTKYPSIQFGVANALEASSLGVKVYDVAILRGVLHHLSDQQLAIKNTARICKNLIIIEPNGNNPVLKVIEKLSPYHREHEEQSFASHLLRSWCKQAELRVSSLAYVGFVPFFFPTIFAKLIYLFQPLLESLPILRNYLSAQIVIHAIHE